MLVILNTWKKKQIDFILEKWKNKETQLYCRRSFFQFSYALTYINQYLEQQRICNFPLT